MKESSNVAILILAAGAGQRMNADQPKQFLTLNGKSILYYTVQNIVAKAPLMDVYIVTQEVYIPMIQAMLEEDFKEENINVLLGGKERFDSTQAALKQIVDYEYILIHDAARPFVSAQVIETGLKQLKKYKVVVPAIPVTDTVRQIQNGQSLMLDRNHLRVIQTPQFFKGKYLKKVFSETEFQPFFTDDASVMENAGFEVQLIDGNEENIKITYPKDLILAEYLLNNQYK